MELAAILANSGSPAAAELGEAVVPFQLTVPQTAIDDLHQRLDRTRWPDRETVDDWSQGAPLAAVRELCRYWRHDYDWRRCEAMLNNLGQYRTAIDGLGIHFLHVRSPEPDALPMILTHGWPGSVIEFHKIIGPLTDPAAHGGDPRHAFHLVVPSLPGYGFSDHPEATGWTVQRTAAAWAVLMRRLGYDRYVAQGGDWGAMVTTALARLAPPELAAIHLNMVVSRPLPEDAPFSAVEQRALDDAAQFGKVGSGYSAIQATRPQTLGYGLSDSPAGQAAWIYEKLAAWSDCEGDPATIFTPDEMLDNISLYWLTGSATSSARLYWESFARIGTEPTALPMAATIFPREIFRASRRWAERTFPNVIHWGEAARGGHFAAFEQPAAFTAEIVASFRSIR